MALLPAAAQQSVAACAEDQGSGHVVPGLAGCNCIGLIVGVCSLKSFGGRQHPAALQRRSPSLPAELCACQLIPALGSWLGRMCRAAGALDSVDCQTFAAAKQSLPNEKYRTFRAERDLARIAKPTSSRRRMRNRTKGLDLSRLLRRILLVVHVLPGVVKVLRRTVPLTHEPSNLAACKVRPSKICSALTRAQQVHGQIKHVLPFA